MICYTLTRVNRMDRFTTIPIAILLFLGSVLLLFLIKASELPAVVKSGSTVVVELTEAAGDRDSLRAWLTSNPYVDRSTIRYISKEAALTDMFDEFPDLGKWETENPFLDIYTFRIYGKHHSEDKLKQLEAEAGKFDATGKVYYQSAVSKTAERLLNHIAWVLGGLVIVLILVMTFFIYHILRAKLVAQQSIIRLMEIVGANRKTIIRPFLWDTGRFMAISAGIAMMLLCFLAFLLNRIGDIVMHITIFELTLSFIFIIFVGLSVGIVGTYIIVNLYLKEFYQSA